MTKWGFNEYLDVIELRYVHGLTFEAIGKEYGITKERARQVNKKAKKYIDKKYYYNSLKWAYYG
jgi:DNA-directed RNA polymerase sigma subunit (sigma70/sigma32)